jgi:ATP-dependent DNA helicase RecQ
MSCSSNERYQLAQQILHAHFGYNDFRPAQRRVVQSILGGHDTLAILPTGGGKSICFQIPALVLGGLTIVVSPLISLMQDQVEALARRGIAGAFLKSSLTQAQASMVMRRIACGELRLLYVSPERLESLAGELRQAGVRPTLLAVDEAHCISEWGHDFRPAYRLIAKARYLLGSPPVLALTGSATPEVREDILRSLRVRNPRTVLGSFDRSNLWFGVIPVKNDRERVDALMTALGREDRMAIVYAPTRGQTEILAKLLRDRGHRASPYHAGLDPGVRQQTLHGFLRDELDIVVATSAFGMGIDKPTVRLVVHWTMPPTMESYYQEAGRAGRDGRSARCILLHHPEDSDLIERQIGTTFPPRRLLEKLWTKPGAIDGVSRSIAESAERLRRELRPDAGPVDWSGVTARLRRARARLESMQRYATTKGCRRRIMLGYFGERPGTCHGCDRCGSSSQRPAPPAPGNGHRRKQIDTTSTMVQRWGKRLGLLPGEVITPSAAQPVHNPLTRALESWRSAAAEPRAQDPAEIVSDQALTSIARTRPSDLAALSLIEGIGPRFITKYGNEILATIDAFGSATPAADTSPER